MSNDGTATLVGNMTRDPKLSFTPSGQAVCEIGIALNSRKKVDNEWVDGDPKFFDVTVWGQMGENVAECLEKGNRVMVIGRPDFRQWTDKESGDKRSKVSFVADAIGPDLRWATAEVIRNERKGPEDREERSRYGGGSSAEADERPF